MEEPLNEKLNTERERRFGARRIILIALSAAIIIAAFCVFYFYGMAHRGAYLRRDFLLPAVSIAAFAAIAVLMLPRLIDTLAGREQLYCGLPYEYISDAPKNVRKSFLKIIIAALVLHTVTGLIGALLFSACYKLPLTDGRFFEIWRSAWMKSNTDAGHYLNIAENWYVKDGVDKLLIVFFPMLPSLVNILNHLTHDSFVSAQIINNIATCLTAGMTYLTLIPLLGDRRAKCAAFITLLLPGAIFMNSPMTEPLFMLFSVCCFYFIQKRRFILAGIFCALAGYTRSLGVLLAVPLFISGIGHIVGLIRSKKKWWPAALRLFIGLVISSFGTLAYLYINYSIHGDCFKFFEYQATNWYQQAIPFYDTPVYMLRYLLRDLDTAPDTVVSLWLCGFAAIYGSLALMIHRARRLPAAYTVYFLCYFAVAVGCSWLLSATRYLCAALPVTVGVSIGCDKKWKTIAIFVLLAVLYILYMLMYMLRWDVY